MHGLCRKDDITIVKHYIDRAISAKTDNRPQFQQDVKDSDKGAVKICVVPYNQDIELKFFTLKQKRYQKDHFQQGIRGTVPDVGWVKEDGVLKVQYRLSEADDLRATSVTTMPDKQYFQFLGIQ